MLPSFQEMYHAIGQKRSDYEGIFVTAVKSTKIFCRPSCRARKPLAKNVEFFATPKEALLNGYRPCKICRPMEKEKKTPLEIQNLIREIHRKPSVKMKDSDLRKKGMKPVQIRRWFNRHHGMTFQAYQRMIRINSGFHQIQKGESVTDSAFASGYESLSGFQDGFKSIFGHSPKKSLNRKVMTINRFTTRLGPMFVATTDQGICLLEFTDRRMLENELKVLCRTRNAVFIPGTHPHIKKLKEQLALYFQGKLQKFTVKLDFSGTEFQKKVWKLLLKIPYGKTWSYQDQANRLGNPKAVRAVARANGMNRIALVIPCHRVIGSDGKLTGYAGGLARKKWLLEMEKQNSQ